MYFTHFTVKALAVLTGKCYLDFLVTLLPSTCILYRTSGVIFFIVYCTAIRDT
jgi:hypothetical protein